MRQPNAAAAHSEIAPLSGGPLASAVGVRVRGGHALVERARAEALQVDGYEAKPELAQLAIDDIARRRLEQPRDLRLLDLQARDLAVIAHARHPKTHRVQNPLAASDSLEALKRDPRAVGKARR